MARETKTQRNAREFEENRIYMEAYAQKYPERLMNALRQANRYCYYLSVSDDNQFVVTNPTKTWNGTWKLPYSITPTSYFQPLEDLESDIAEKETEVKEQKRKSDIRQAALDKLSDEEKELLDLN